MKRIIRGKRYDTATAKPVTSYWNGLPTSDFNTVTETLYLTDRGQWFLHGEGGPMSRWAEPAGDMMGSGERIQLLTPHEAAAWMEAHNKVEALEEFLGLEIEDG
jgi:hypothetical protein